MIQNVWLQLAMEKTAKVEIERCYKDFSYFAKNYLYFNHPQHGRTSLELKPFHERLADHYTSNKFSIVTKFRSAGYTTYTIAYMLWQAMFRLDQRIMFLARSDDDAITLGKWCKMWVENFPQWMQPKLKKHNNHRIEFEETNSSIDFHAPEACRGRSLNWLILDDAAFIPDMATHWKAMWPTLSTGGKMIAVSTVGKKWDDKKNRNWFYGMHCDAFEGKNQCSIFKSHYAEHPLYADPKLCELYRERLGTEGWKQEFEMEFLD